MFCKTKRFFIVSVLMLVFLIPANAFAGSEAHVSRLWRGEIRAQLKRHHIWSKEKENRIIHIIAGESGGSPSARNGSCVGLLQLNGGWKHNYSKSYFSKHKVSTYKKDNRLSGSWSIHRIVKVYKDGGTAAVKRHWAATYY